MHFYENTQWQNAFSKSAAGTAVSCCSCDSRTANVSDRRLSYFWCGAHIGTNWLKAHQKGGDAALKAHKRGPKHQSRLAGHQAATVVRLITDRCPDQLKLPFALWTRDAVRQWIEKRYGISVSVWTVGRYLQQWGFTPQKPLRRAYEQDPQAVQRWLEHDYPAIRRQARTRTSLWR
jgi:transposase